jgi:hypothetical protein
MKGTQVQKSWLTKAWRWPDKVLTGGVTVVKKTFKKLKNRYGPRFTYAMLLSVFLGLFSPMPGTSLVAIAFIVLVAEVSPGDFQEFGVMGSLLENPGTGGTGESKRIVVRAWCLATEVPAAALRVGVGSACIGLVSVNAVRLHRRPRRGASSASGLGFPPRSAPNSGPWP